MDRDIPSFNRPIMDRIYAKNHELHQKRLKNIKKGKNNSSSLHNKQINSTYYSNLPAPNNKKGRLMEQVQREEIQKQNAKLFKKMMKIMKRPDPLNNPDVIRHHQSSITSASQAKNRISLEFSRINEENKQFYHRLERQKPTIDNKKLEEERMKNLNILKFLGKYPNASATKSNRAVYLPPSTSHHQRSLNLRNNRMNSTQYDSKITRNTMRQANNDEGELDVYLSKVNPRKKMAKGNFDAQIEALRRQEEEEQAANFEHQQSCDHYRYGPKDAGRRKFMSQGMQRKDLHRNHREKPNFRTNEINRTIEQNQEFRWMKDQQQSQQPQLGFEGIDLMPVRVGKPRNLVNYMPPIPSNKAYNAPVSVPSQSSSKGARFTVHPSILLFKAKSHELVAGQIFEVSFYRESDVYKISASRIGQSKGKSKSTSKNIQEKHLKDIGDYLELQIPQNEGTEFLSTYDYDYKRVMRMLVIESQDDETDDLESRSSYRLAIDINEQKHRERIETYNRQVTQIEDFHESSQQNKQETDDQMKQNLRQKQNNDANAVVVTDSLGLSQTFQEIRVAAQKQEQKPQIGGENIRGNQIKTQNELLPVSEEKSDAQQNTIFQAGKYEEALDEELD